MSRFHFLFYGVACLIMLLVPGAVIAERPLYQDAEGIWFRTPSGTVLQVGMNGEVAIDGQVLANCHQTPSAEVDRHIGEAECTGGYFWIEDRFGNELMVYPTMAEASTAYGSEYELLLSRSPVRVRVDISGGDIRIETAAETVVFEESGEVGIAAPGGEEVIVTGEDMRIRAGGLEVTGDWRTSGRYSGADTERVLVELGATTKDDLIQLALSGDILFDFDSTEIRQDAALTLGKAAHIIRQRSFGDVYIVGHTDSVGEQDYNQKLSEKRALAVMSFLNQREGIPVAIMVARGMGSRRPVAHNTRPDGSDDPVGRAQNRRVEILLATRAGVDVIDVAGLVRVGEEGVNVGGAVIVDEAGVEVGGGAIRVDEGGIRVGGVEVTPGGVKVESGGTRAEGGIVGDGAPVACQPANVCDWTCPEGDCDMTCKPGAVCDFGCSGGDCIMRCQPGATCNFSCNGGDCTFACSPGSMCNTSCVGGDCRRS